MACLLYDVLVPCVVSQLDYITLHLHTWSGTQYLIFWLLTFFSMTYGVNYCYHKGRDLADLV